MRLFINAVATYPEGTALSDEDRESIREDIDDLLRWPGFAPGSGVVVEMEEKT